MLALAEAARHGAPTLYAETAARFLAMHALLRQGGHAQVMPLGQDAGRLGEVEDFMRAQSVRKAYGETFDA